MKQPMCFKKKNNNDTNKDFQYTYGTTDEKDYMEKRLLPQIRYYSKSSRWLRREYYIISILSTVLMAAIPVITIWPDATESNLTRYIVASISALSSVLSSVLLIRKTKDNWVAYRIASQMLKSELATFKAKAAEYHIPDHNSRFVLFVERCENIMQTEQTGWYSRMKLESNQTNGVTGTSEETGS